MNDHPDLMAADAARRRAMIAGDTGALAGLLADDLVWTHSSGKTDDKTSFLSGIASGTVQYHALDVEEVRVLERTELFVCQGTLVGRASRDGVEKPLRNRFLSVWERRGDALRMLAWQSTGF